MKKITAVLILVLVLASVAAEADQTLLFVADRDFSPYSSMVEGQPAGIDVDVLMEAAKRADVSLKVELKPWEELISMVEKGECVGAAGLFRTPEREQHAMFMDARPIHLSRYALFTKVGSVFKFDDYGDLKGKVIGTVSGVDLGEAFNAAKTSGGMHVKEYEDISLAIRGLLQGEIDSFAGNIDVTYARLKPMGMTSSVVYLPKMILVDKPAYVVLSRASDVVEDKDLLIQKLERSLDSMMRDGTYNRLAKRYLFRF